MRNRFSHARRALSVLLVLLAAFVAAPGVSYAGPAAQDAASDAARRAARARWEKLTPEQRRSMRERFEKLERMSPQERERVTARANRLNELRRNLWKSLDREHRARLDTLSNEKRLELLDELLADEIEATVQRIIARMPEKDQRRLEAARPQDRVRFLMERKRLQDQENDDNLRRIGIELGVRPQDVAGFRDLAPAQRREKMRELLRERIVRNVEASGLPAGIDRAGWQRIQALPEDDFFHAITRLRRSHPTFGSGRDSVSAGSAQAKLRRALQGRPEERMALSHLTREDRQKALMESRRERVLEVIRAERLVPAERILELESAPYPRFMRIVRGLSSLPRPAQRGPRERPRRGGG